MTEGDIFFWTRNGSNGYLSNFWRASIIIDGKSYATSEHYYQAMKTNNPAEQEMVRNTTSPKEAKFAGYHVTLREDWEEVKEAIMFEALTAKFTQHTELGLKLIETGNKPIHEDSPWDRYWGYAKGEGKDKLGVLLMRVRDELMEEVEDLLV